MNPLIRYLALPVMRAIGKAPHVLCFDAAALQSAMVGQGLEIVSVERHGTQGRDFRVFIVARKPSPAGGSRPHASESSAVALPWKRRGHDPPNHQ